MHKPSTMGRRWPAWVLGFAITLVLSFTTLAFVRVESERRARTQEASVEQVEACERQHALIEMQRLFLAEHAAIRLQLMDAGIPDRHAHPGLLKELERLIEQGDCVVGQDIEASAD